MFLFPGEPVSRRTWEEAVPSAATSGRWPFIGPVRRSKLPEMQSGVVQVRTDVRSSQLVGDKVGRGEMGSWAGGE
jgi:hypothetical protein